MLGMHVPPAQSNTGQHGRPILLLVMVHVLGMIFRWSAHMISGCCPTTQLVMLCIFRYECTCLLMMTMVDV